MSDLSAWHDADDDVPIERLFNRALALKQSDRWRDAVNGFELVLRRLERDPDDRHELIRRSLVLKVACLDELGQPNETVAACDEFLSRYEGERSNATQVGLLTDVLWIKAKTFHLAGEKEKEHEINQLLISQFADDAAMGSVAAAMYNDGIYLRDAGRGAEAVAMWDKLWARFSKDWPESAGLLPIQGQLATSTFLARSGQLDSALLTCDRMLQECHARSLPDDEVQRARRLCVQLAARDRSKAARLRQLLRRK